MSKKKSAWSVAAEIAQKQGAVEQDATETAIPQNGKTVKQKVTLYLTWEHIDKLNSLETEYWKKKRRRTDPNKIMRLLIERASIDDVL